MMESTNGLISALTILDVLPLLIRQSISTLLLFYLHIANLRYVIQDRPGYLSEIAQQQLLDRGYYGTAVMRTLQDVISCFDSTRKQQRSQRHSVKFNSLLSRVSDFWQIDSWKELVPCVVTRMPEVTNATSVVSWLMPLS